MAKTIAGHPPLGVRHSKRGFDRSATGDLRAALARELEAELACFEEPEVRANLRAFSRRKRPPPAS
jgi:enoyl-CoA hydratase/carnithine racemase